MCGIAGVSWSQPRRLPDRDEVERMVDALAHRGPDARGIYHSDKGFIDGPNTHGDWPESPSSTGAILGHRRLSIIDLAGGQQPLSNEDQTIWVILNGEIYNYRELRDQLKLRGHQFATDSDTEVIVHLYEDMGDRYVDELRGMFAIAIWDSKKQRLLLARDRIGQKPLVYREANGRLDFASEFKSLMQLQDAPREIDVRSIDLYLTYQYVPHPTSMLVGYQKLAPGHLAVYESGNLTVKRYWKPPYEQGSIGHVDPASTEPNEALAGCKTWTKEKWQSALRDTLTEAVRLRMRSDVPLGSFLSGGIDSTIISGLMQQLSDRPIHTFSIGFPVAKFDETAFAREASEHLGTEHHEQIVTPSALDILPKLVWHYDEPFSDSSSIPTMYLSQMTREHVTVSLSGDGGDELFAGYDRYKAVRMGHWFDRLPRPIRAFMTAKIWQKIPASTEQRSFRRRAKRFLSALGDSPQRRYLRWISIFDSHVRSELISDDVKARLNAHDAATFIESTYTMCPDRDFVTQTTCADVQSYLPCDIMTKVDIASMAFGLEARSPFLDHRVVELAAKMPLDLKLNGNQGKQILIDTFSDLLPASIQSRPKMGFGVPIDHWFRNELKPLLYDVLLSKQTLDRGLFNSETVRKFVDEHVSAKWDHSYRLWNLLVFEVWQRTYVDRTDTSMPLASL
jgi:asparagine synthase (glutamine-hydrolysing)